MKKANQDIRDYATKKGVYFWEIALKLSISEPTMTRWMRAEIFGISRHYCRQLALTGAVRAVRVGRGKILINVQSMADFFNQSSIPEPTDEAPNQGVIRPIPVKI